jgi:hypothetical protein
MTYIEKFLAWLRGDYADIVSEFKTLTAKLDAHTAHKLKVANQKKAAAEKASADATTAATEATKAANTSEKIKALIS